MKPSSPILKRPFDIFLSILGLLFFLPLGLLFSLTILVEDGNPILYVQERWGRNGRKFRALKFRTMAPGRNGKGTSASGANTPFDKFVPGFNPLTLPSPPPGERVKGEREIGVEFVKRPTNGRQVTKVGRVLRATAMDELPQLINILRGEMSFVGPRALAVDELDASSPGFSERHRIRPGLTGPAQIYACRDASFEEKFRYDLDYLKNQSFGKDLGLLFLSLWVTLRGKWESREKKV